MSIITGENPPLYRLQSDTDPSRSYTDSTMKFIDVWDGEELAQLFYDDRRLVPDEPKLLANWLTVITRMDEGSINPAIFADVVYISNPSQRVIVRFKGIVRNVRLELPQCVPLIHRTLR